ncbi:ABC transporter substrate-binding protein [Knoellia flava TL1]|uniref:ABC transporter substrate-binding protein n=2 Tax=Knoellia flava TaxID=913969 RepID=A0A8H9FSH8_9MICO|nr:MlaD family protein [Knoellia flava]KGN33483.1 ABC transporter substrate-binding protein [Knoellia flava TL1]GGB73898.1 ABC transporter substrate-binding protein [Knoellia flava]
MSRPFSSRDPLRIGIAGLGAIAIVLLAAFNAASLPLIGGGEKYAASFTEAGGLRDGDEVRIAGVRVGKVTDIRLAGNKVDVDFRITEDVAFGPETGASVRMKTLLGQKYVSLEPRGRGQMKEGTTIPTSRTVSSYDIIDAFSDLTETTERIDTDLLADSLDTMAREFTDTPANVTLALDGLSRLSRTVASRDTELKALLKAANSVSGTLADQNKVIEKIIVDADLLLAELYERRDAIHTLFTNTSAMAVQITGLVRDNRAQLGPALEQLRGVLATLRKHEADLTRTIDAMQPFTRVFASTLGTGQWFDTYIQNLTVPVGAVGR